MDRLLTSVLQQYQDVHDDARTDNIYALTTTLLTNLSNPLNVSLLTSQLLTAPAIWARGDGIRACFRIISLFNTAAIHVRRNELENAKLKDAPAQPPPQSYAAGFAPPPQQPQRRGGGISSNAWAAAVLKGADDQSVRWQHLLVFTGVLLGFEGNNRSSLSSNMRNTLEKAVVTAANLAVRNRTPEPPAPPSPVALALNYAFPLLAESVRAELDSDALVPVLAQAMLGPDCLEEGVFVASIDIDVKQVDEKFHWAENSPSFLHISQLERKPLVSGLGPLSRLLAHAVQHSRNSQAVMQLLDDLVAFTGRLLQYWESCKLSELEMSEEEFFLTPEMLQTTWTALWLFLKKIMYAVVAVLHAIVARSLIDRHMRQDAIAPLVAHKTLLALRNLYFISSRNSAYAFQVYSFTYLTSLDTLSRYPDAAASFLSSIKPTATAPPANANIGNANGSLPAHPLHRILDLYYLNVAEHLPLNLPTPSCDSLIIQPALIYLTPSSITSPFPNPLPPRVIELFEAAHSAVLAVLSCPHNAPLTANIIPFYISTLLSSFPSHITPRQFRLAFKTVLQIVSPPFPLSKSHPEMAETLLEMVRFRAATSKSDPVATAILPSQQRDGEQQQEEPMSEQSTLVLTLLDSLPYLSDAIFEEWLTLAARAVHDISGPDAARLKEVAKRRFWDVLSSGEMDVERATRALAWWGTRGGRGMVLFGRFPEGETIEGDCVIDVPGGQEAAKEGGEKYLMSGALPKDEKEEGKEEKIRSKL